MPDFIGKYHLRIITGQLWISKYNKITKLFTKGPIKSKKALFNKKRLKQAWLKVSMIAFQLIVLNMELINLSSLWTCEVIIKFAEKSENDAQLKNAIKSTEKETLETLNSYCSVMFN